MTRYMGTKGNLGYILPLILLLPAGLTTPTFAFPPYRSTDADTADPDTLELRVGLVKLEHEKSETEVITPSLRANFGLQNKVELISEFEYLPEEGAFGDAAAGIKWIPLFGNTLSFGTETLALLPVRPGDSGVGVESQLLATYWSDEVRLHINAGGFHDPRVSPSEDGWRASLLAEFPREGYRPGVELFAKEIEGQPVDVRAGVGLIYDMGSYALRTGLHVGLTKEAPDVSFNLWIATSVPF